MPKEWLISPSLTIIIYVQGSGGNGGNIDPGRRSISVHTQILNTLFKDHVNRCFPPHNVTVGFTLPIQSLVYQLHLIFVDQLGQDGWHFRIGKTRWSVTFFFSTKFGTALLATDTCSKSKWKWLTSLFEVRTHGVCPTLWHEGVGILEILRIMCHGPCAGIDFGLVKD